MTSSSCSCLRLTIYQPFTNQSRFFSRKQSLQFFHSRTKSEILPLNVPVNKTDYYVHVRLSNNLLTFCVIRDILSAAAGCSTTRLAHCVCLCLFCLWKMLMLQVAAGCLSVSYAQWCNAHIFHKTLAFGQQMRHMLLAFPHM